MMELYDEQEEEAYKAYQKAQYENEMYAIKEYQKAISEFDFGEINYCTLSQLKDWAESLRTHAKTARELYGNLDQTEYI